MIVYDYFRSSAAFRLRIALNLKGLSPERRYVHLANNAHRTAKYLAVNPQGFVPYLIDDDGFVLWESNAIVRYLSAKHGAGGLWPADVQIRAAGDRWMDWATSTMAPIMTPLFWGMIRTPPEKRNAQAIESDRVKMEAVMAILDAHLAGRPFVAGDTFGMGDVPVGCFTYRWYALPMAHGEHPHLAAWYERLKMRPGFRDNVMLPLV